MFLVSTVLSVIFEYFHMFLLFFTIIAQLACALVSTHSALNYFHSSVVIFSLNWKWVQWPPDDTDSIQPSLYSKTKHTLFLVWHFFVLILRSHCKSHLFCLASGVCQAIQPLKCRFDGNTDKVRSISTLFISGVTALWFQLGRRH